jgi:hypothetical protein
MNKLLLPLFLGLVGLGGGAGAGLYFRPAPAPDAHGQGDAAAGATAEGERTHGGDDHGAGAKADGRGDDHGDDHGDAHADDHGEEPTTDFVKLNNQFVVPVVEGGEVSALVILSLTVESALGTTERVYAQEPKLRDEFLQVLFDHANAGGFNGLFTGSNNLDVLRMALLEAAQGVLGNDALDILIVDIVRQDT